MTKIIVLCDDQVSQKDIYLFGAYLLDKFSCFLSSCEGLSQLFPEFEI
jgi:hypothetical protein